MRKWVERYTKKKMLQEIKSAERLKGLGYMKRTECNKKKFIENVFEKKKGKNVEIKDGRNTRSRCNAVVMKGRGNVSKGWQ